MKWEHQLRRELQEMGYSPYRHASDAEWQDYMARFVADFRREFGSLLYQTERKRITYTVDEANSLDAQEDRDDEGLGGRAVRR